MSEQNLQGFLAENAIKAENKKYVASKRFLGANREPLEWELRVLTSDEDDVIRKSCKSKEFTPGTREVKVTMNNDKYAEELVCSCVVYPNLNDAKLQDSYGAVGAAALIKKMLTPGEFTDLYLTVSEINGFKSGMADKIKSAKN